MTKVKTEKAIYATTEYSMFKRLEGNRAIKDSRVEKIIDSINRVGYVTSPILVNEKMEVIDGQGRLSALERLQMPVEYIIHEGATVKECRAMNIHQSNWTDYDFVCSYAEMGDENYERLRFLMDHHEVPSAVIIASTMPRLTEGSGQHSKSIRSGGFKVSKKDAETAGEALVFAERFKQVAESIGGKKAAFYIATLYAFRNLDEKQRDRLERVVRQNMLDIPALAKSGGYLKYFDAFYNLGLHRKNRIALEIQWQLDSM